MSLTTREAFARLLLALATVLPCAPLSAQEVTEEVARQNTAEAPQEDFSWMSGGIGDEALQEMRRTAAAYNVHVLFSDRQGHYLANVPFAVVGRDGRQIYSGVSDGPMLYLRLPGGAYRVSAEIDGIWQNRAVRAGGKGRPARLSFVARGE